MKLLVTDLSWNRRRELTKNEKPITGTNIIDLIYHAIRSSKGAAPVGSDQWMISMKECNVPESWLANMNRTKTSQTPMKEATIDRHTPFVPQFTQHSTPVRKSIRSRKVPAQQQSPSWKYYK